MRALLLAAVAILLPAAGPPPLHGYVDPMIGVGNDNQGDTIPGPALPAGSIHPSPETLTGSNAGYDPAAPVSGFAQLHTQGSGGVTTYGTFLVSPQTGALALAERDHLSAKADEKAGADGYSVTLTRYRTGVEIAPAHHAALYRFTFPQDETPILLLDVTRKIRGELGSAGADVTLDPASGRIVGRVRTKDYWSPALVDIWFCAEVDRAPSGWGVATEGQRSDGARTGHVEADRQLAAWWSFDRGGAPVTMKIAVSFTSAERAKELLDRDLPGWDMGQVRSAAAKAWDKALGRLTIEGIGAADRRRFYTALYHTMIQPRDRTLDQPVADRATPLWDDHYTLWDTYRTAFPLMSLVRPKDLAGNIASMIRTWERFGGADTAFIAGRNYQVGQGGDEVDNVIGEALIRGVPGVDWAKAANVVRTNAFERRRPRYLVDGWFAVGDKSPEFDHDRARSGSSTLAFALNDFYAARLATQAGRSEEAATLAQRSNNWRKVWDEDASSDGFSGFILPRYADGRFQPLDPKLGWDGKTYNNVGFYEGSSWTYSFGILQDVPGMIAAMGGRARFVDRLDHALSAGLVDITNEPSFAAPWLFSDAGRPDLASRWANEVFQRFTASAYPGDEDAGAMSSHYVFNRIGLFPKLTTDLYYLHAPHQPETALVLEDGKTFRLVARNSAPGRIYIERATLNGRALDRPYLHQAEIMAGGTLDLLLSDCPTAWARSERPDARSPDMLRQH